MRFWRFVNVELTVAALSFLVSLLAFSCEAHVIKNTMIL